jgi:hypothetical protein
MKNFWKSIFGFRLTNAYLEKTIPRFAVGLAIAFLIYIALRLTSTFFLIGSILGWPDWITWLVFALSSLCLLGAIIYFVRHFLLRYWK